MIAPLATLSDLPTSVCEPVITTLSMLSPVAKAVLVYPSSVNAVPSYSFLSLSAVIVNGALSMLSVPTVFVKVL